MSRNPYRRFIILSGSSKKFLERLCSPPIICMVNASSYVDLKSSRQISSPCRFRFGFLRDYNTLKNRLIVPTNSLETATSIIFMLAITLYGVEIILSTKIRSYVRMNTASETLYL